MREAAETIELVALRGGAGRPALRNLVSILRRVGKRLIPTAATLPGLIVLTDRALPAPATRCSGLNARWRRSTRWSTGAKRSFAN
jgi:hypothetical protein